MVWCRIDRTAIRHEKDEKTRDWMQPDSNLTIEITDSQEKQNVQIYAGFKQVKICAKNDGESHRACELLHMNFMS